MTIEQRNNLNRSNRDMVNDKKNRISPNGRDKMGKGCRIIDDELTSHLDACARASKIRERVPLLYPLPCGEKVIQSRQRSLYESDNTKRTSSISKSMAGSTNFDKDRFQILMTKRKSLAQIQAKVCSKSWNVRNVCDNLIEKTPRSPLPPSIEERILWHQGRQSMVASTMDNHYSLGTNHSSTPITKTTNQQTLSSSSVLYNPKEYPTNASKWVGVEKKPTSDMQGRINNTTSLFGRSIQPTCKQKLKELATRHRVLPSTPRLERFKSESKNLQTLTLETSLDDESLHCITIDGDDEPYRNEDNHKDDLTLESNVSFLDAMECSEDVGVSFSSDMVSRDVKGNHGKERISKGNTRNVRGVDQNGVNYLAQLQTLIGIQQENHHSPSDVHITSTCNLWVKGKTSKCTSHHIENDVLCDTLKTMDEDLASIVSSQVTLDGINDKDHCEQWGNKLCKGTNCSLLRYCLMVWFVSLVLIYERSWSHEIYLLSSWRRIVEQSMKEAIHSQIHNLENMTVLQTLSKSMGSVKGVLQPAPYGQSYREEVVMRIASEEFQTATKVKNDTMALENLVHHHFIGQMSAEEEYNLPMHQVMTPDTCSIDVMFYRDMTTDSPIKEASIFVEEINSDVHGMNSTFMNNGTTEDTKSQLLTHKDEIFNMTTVAQSSVVRPRIEKVRFWSSRRYIPFMSSKLAHGDFVHDLNIMSSLRSTSNLSSSFLTVKKSSHGLLNGQSSFPDMPSYQAFEYLHSRHSLEDEDVSIIDVAMDLFRITVEAWKRKRHNRRRATQNVSM